jgi:hypothetical protein
VPCLTPHHIIPYSTMIYRTIPYYTVPSMSSFSSASFELPLTSAFCPKADGLASQYLKGKEGRREGGKEGQKQRHIGVRVGRGQRGEKGRIDRQRV